MKRPGDETSAVINRPMMNRPHTRIIPRGILWSRPSHSAHSKLYPHDLSIVIHSFIHYEDLYSASSRLLLRSAPDPCMAKKKSFEARVGCVSKNPGEQSLRQRKPIPHWRGQPPRMHGPELWRYEQKEQRVTPVLMSGVNCDLWFPGWDSTNLGGRPEQDSGYTSRQGHQYGI